MDSKTNAEALKELIDPSRIAKRCDWKSKPMPREHMSIELALRFDKSEMDAIRDGVLPYQMEDKWFIFYDQGKNDKGKLHFHRSWTGLCPYVGHFKNDDEGAILYRINVNRKIEQTFDDPEREILSFLSIVGVMLLGREPLVNNSGSGDDLLALWGSFGRAYFKVDE